MRKAKPLSSAAIDAIYRAGRAEQSTTAKRQRVESARAFVDSATTQKALRKIRRAVRALEKIDAQLLAPEIRRLKRRDREADLRRAIRRRPAHRPERFPDLMRGLRGLVAAGEDAATISHFCFVHVLPHLPGNHGLTEDTLFESIRKKSTKRRHNS